ncbi:MAG: DNA primase [Burkholderiaceae bacterium]|nr:MAG: DNA primase [Burkholderiaceae bacterium]
MIPQSFIQDLLNRVDVVEVVGRAVQLKKAGANFSGLCPFHNEKTPSFTVSPAKQFYHCFGCGAHGSAIGFLMEYQGMDYVEAIKELAQSIGVPVPEEDRLPPQQRQQQQAHSLTLLDALARARDHYRHALRGATRAIEYLKGRGLTGEIAARYAMGYAPDGWQTLAEVFENYQDPTLLEAGLVIDSEKDGKAGRRYDRFRDRIMFPIRNLRGQVIGFGGRVIDQGEPKYLNSPETPVFHKGSELYGLFEARQAIREAGAAIVVEGYMDVVALAQLGFTHAVATLGTAVTAQHVQKLLRHTDAIVFSFDGDNAGRKAAWRALEASLPLAADNKTLRFLFLPSEHDPDSYVRTLGAPAFATALQEALPLSQYLLQGLCEGKDLTLAEERARLLHEAKPFVQALPAGALRLQIVRELAQRAGSSADEVAQLYELRSAATPAAQAAQSARQQQRPQAAQRLNKNRPQPSARRRVLLLLVTHPQYLTWLRDPQVVADFLPEPTQLAAFDLLTQWATEDTAPASFPALVEAARVLPEGHPLNLLLQEALAEDWLMELDAEAELQAAFHGFRRQKLEQDMRAALDAGDVARYRSLDQQLRQLQQRQS